MTNTAVHIIATVKMAESSFSKDDTKEEEKPLATFRLNV